MRVALGWTGFVRDGVRRSSILDPNSRRGFLGLVGTLLAGWKELAAPPKKRLPSRPTGLVATSGDGRVLLQWNPNPRSEKVDSYRVYLNDVELNVVVIGTTYELTGLTNDQTYRVRIAAHNSAGTGPYTDPVVTVIPRGTLGTQWYVTKAGNDTTGNGSANSPWLTIKKATDTVTSGQINVGQGTFVETGTLVLDDGVSLVGTGQSLTIVRCSSSAVDPLLLVENTTSPQTISDLRLDGQSQTTADVGLWAENTQGLTITRVDARGFVGEFASTPGNCGGGGINILGATDFELSYSSLSGSGGDWGTRCTANLGLGNLLRAEVHHLTIISSGMCVQRSNPDTFPVSQDVDIHHNYFDSQSYNCALWATLSVEFWWTAINCTFRNNYLNKILSLPEGGTNGDPGGGRYRWRIHNNHFDMPDDASSQYGIELGIDYTEVDHNWINSYLYPLAHFHPGDVQDHITVHHNVFDHTQGQAAMWLESEQLTNAVMYNNTVVMREAAYADGVLSLGADRVPPWPNDSTGSFDDSIVYAVSALGDKMGKGIDLITFDGNSFWNVTPKGTNTITDNPNLPLIGSWPAPYVPTGTPATKGAFADGTFTVGPT